MALILGAKDETGAAVVQDVQQVHSTTQSTVRTLIFGAFEQKLAGIVPVSPDSSNLACVMIAVLANSGMVPVNALSKKR